MPPTTEDGLAADKALDAKLDAFYESEVAETAAPEAPAAPETAADTATEPETAAVEPETPVKPPSEAATDDPDVAAVLQKYGGDPNKALRALVDAQSLIGRQGQELGDLRREFEQQIAAIQQQNEQRHVASQAPGAVETLLDQGNFHAAAEYARQAGNTVLYNHVMGQWAADPEQAYGAINYATAVATMQTEAKLEQLVEQRLSGIQEATQPLIAGQAQQNFERDFAVFAQDKTDINNVAPEMLRVAQENEAVVSSLLGNEDPAVRQQAFQFLYTTARGRIGDTLTQAAHEADTAAQEAAAAAKTAATVGSASTASQAKPMSKVDQAKAEFREILFDDRTSIQKGLVRGT